MCVYIYKYTYIHICTPICIYICIYLYIYFFIFNSIIGVSDEELATGVQVQFERMIKR